MGEAPNVVLPPEHNEAKAAAAVEVDAADSGPHQVSSKYGNSKAMTTRSPRPTNVVHEKAIPSESDEESDGDDSSSWTAPATTPRTTGRKPEERSDYDTDTDLESLFNNAGAGAFTTKQGIHESASTTSTHGMPTGPNNVIADDKTQSKLPRRRWRDAKRGRVIDYDDSDYSSGDCEDVTAQGASGAVDFWSGSSPMKSRTARRRDRLEEWNDRGSSSDENGGSDDDMRTDSYLAKSAGKIPSFASSKSSVSRNQYYWRDDTDILRSKVSGNHGEVGSRSLRLDSDFRSQHLEADNLPKALNFKELQPQPRKRNHGSSASFSGVSGSHLRGKTEKIFHSFQKFGSGSDEEESKTIAVRNLASTVTEETLREFFGGVGAVVNVQRRFGSANCAYVEFKSTAAAKKAVQKNGTKLHERVIICDLAQKNSTFRPKSAEPPSELAQEPSEAPLSALDYLATLIKLDVPGDSKGRDRIEMATRSIRLKGPARDYGSTHVSSGSWNCNIDRQVQPLDDSPGDSQPTTRRGSLRGLRKLSRSWGKFRRKCTGRWNSCKNWWPWTKRAR